MIPLSISYRFRGRRATNIHWRIRVAVRWFGALELPRIRDKILSYLGKYQLSNDSKPLARASLTQLPSLPGVFVWLDICLSQNGDLLV